MGGNISRGEGMMQQAPEQAWRQRILSMDVPPSMLSDAEIAESMDRIRVWIVEDAADFALPLVYQGRMSALQYELDRRKQDGKVTRRVGHQRLYLTAIRKDGPPVGTKYAKRKKKK